MSDERNPLTHPQPGDGILVGASMEMWVEEVKGESSKEGGAGFSVRLRGNDWWCDHGWWEIVPAVMGAQIIGREGQLLPKPWRRVYS